ncbi:DNA mismatch repair protein MLH1 [Lolium perenne]|uniref:DNA mismatch repair protein MLH1 n=1 Tax=Lolium perenne TaxID=4522 RepID=UPI0021F62023|nr:DNA mismatch repair protein MLH1 isoform X1 [Lolium perenne]
MDVDDPTPRGGGGGGEPPRIRRLEESVVNRIAAGEVIQRPSSAVKELVENSIDAGASTVSVTVKDGGLKLIQVSDDGHGIRFEDLPILCERHTTSKLSAYEDLQTITSMGFRGEALASMTYVGHVTVTTITEGQLHGYRVSYRDGVMENDPKPCAAVKGTQVMVENLFYNMVARRKTLQNSNDDYPKIVDFISRFAVHHINVNFSCRKHGSNRADVHSASTSSRIDAIRNVYGASVVRDLMEIEVSDENAVDEIFRMDGFISNANYVAKKTTMILFINDRLVDCTSLKRAIEFVYSAILPQASKPFVYMSINLPPEHVDVNIHPTKKEVSLLNQERIIEMIKDAIEEKLMNCNTTRIFQTQAVNTSALTQASTQKEKGTEVSTPTGAKSQKIPSQMVRTDPRDPSGRLHTYWHGQSSNLEKKSDLVSVRNVVRSRRNPKDAGDLSSRHELLTEIDTNLHLGLLDIVKNCTYVGVADEVFALIQHNTRLYLVNVVNVSKELMYQQALCRFGNFNAIQLSEPAPLRELMMMALKDDESISDENDKEKLEIAEVNTEILKENAEMINEYFSIHIDQSGNLTRLPVVLDQYTPDMDRLPEFALTLGNDVTWDVERDCFRTAAAAIGNFYALHPPILPNPSGNGIQLYKKNKDCMASGERDNDSTNTDEDEIDQELLAEAEAAWAQREWTIQHVLFPSMRLFLKPPKSMATDGTFVQVASLEKLYKIFERC